MTQSDGGQQGDGGQQDVAADLQQVVQNFLVQHPQVAQLPVGQLVGAIQPQPQQQPQPQLQQQPEPQQQVQQQPQPQVQQQQPQVQPQQQPAQPRRQPLIAQQLANFMGVFDSGTAIAQNVPGALAQLTENLGNVGIVYRQQETSRANNPGVSGLQIGELLDMLNTLNRFANQPGFQPARFWTKLVTMHEIMSEEPDDDEED